MLQKITDLLKDNWRSIVVGLFMLFVAVKLLQIESNTEVIHSVEWDLMSIQGEVSDIKKKLSR